MRNIFKNLYDSKIFKNKLPYLIISKEKENQFSLQGKDNNIYKDLMDKGIEKLNSKFFSIIKNNDIILNGIIQFNKNLLNIEKNKEILYLFHTKNKALELSTSFFEIIQSKEDI